MKLNHKFEIYLPHIQQLISFPSILSYSLRTSITPLSSSVLCIGGLLEDKLLVESHRDLLRCFVKISIGPELELVTVFSGIVIVFVQHSSLTGTRPNYIQTKESKSHVILKKITTKIL